MRDNDFREKLDAINGRHFDLDNLDGTKTAHEALGELIALMPDVDGFRFTQSIEDPLLYEYPDKALGMYALQLERDGAEFARGKVLVPLRIVDLAKSYPEFRILIWVPGDKLIFFIEWSQFAPHVNSAAKHFAGGERCAKFFVRGLFENNPGLFLKAKSKAPIINMVPDMHYLGSLPQVSNSSYIQIDPVIASSSELNEIAMNDDDNYLQAARAVVEAKLGVPLEHESRSLFRGNDGTTVHFSKTKGNRKDGYVGVRPTLFSTDWLAIYQTRDAIGWLIPSKVISEHLANVQPSDRSNGLVSWDLWIEIQDAKDRLWKSDSDGEIDIRPFRFSL